MSGCGWRWDGSHFIEEGNADGAAWFFTVCAVDDDLAAFAGVEEDAAGVEADEVSGAVVVGDFDGEVCTLRDGLEDGFSGFEEDAFLVELDADIGRGEVEEADVSGGECGCGFREGDGARGGPGGAGVAPDDGEDVSGFRRGDAEPGLGFWIVRGVAFAEDEWVFSGGDFHGFADAAEVEAGGFLLGRRGGFLGFREAEADEAWRDGAGRGFEFVADAVADFLAEGWGLAEGEEAEGAGRGLFFRGWWIVLTVERGG